MAAARTVLTPREIERVLRDAGLTVTVMPGYYDRCRCHTGSHEKGVGPRARFGPVLGVMVHHTAGSLVSGARAYAYTTNILIAGNGANDTVGPDPESPGAARNGPAPWIADLPKGRRADAYRVPMIFRASSVVAGSRPRAAATFTHHSTCS